MKNQEPIKHEVCSVVRVPQVTAHSRRQPRINPQGDHGNSQVRCHLLLSANRWLGLFRLTQRSIHLEWGSRLVPGSDGITQSCCHGFGEKCCFSEDCKTLYVPTPGSLIPDRVENVPPWLKCSSWVQPKDDIFRKVWEESCGCFWVTIE